MSPNPVETVNNAEQFMVTGDYGTAAALFTLALRHSEVVVPPDLKSVILCKRAKCLLRLVSIVSLSLNHLYVTTRFFFKALDENVSD